MYGDCCDDFTADCPDIESYAKKALGPKVRELGWGRNNRLSASPSHAPLADYHPHLTHTYNHTPPSSHDPQYVATKVRPANVQSKLAIDVKARIASKSLKAKAAKAKSVKTVRPTKALSKRPKDVKARQVAKKVQAAKVTWMGRGSRL